VVVHGRTSLAHESEGTKVAAHYRLVVGAREQVTVRLRLVRADATARSVPAFGPAFDRIFATRRREADEFYDTIIPATLAEDPRRVMRQALAGMLWS